MYISNEESINQHFLFYNPDAMIPMVSLATTKTQDPTTSTISTTTTQGKTFGQTGENRSQI